jgi:hypothetical protein
VLDVRGSGADTTACRCVAAATANRFALPVAQFVRHLDRGDGMLAAANGSVQHLRALDSVHALTAKSAGRGATSPNSKGSPLMMFSISFPDKAGDRLPCR